MMDRQGWIKVEHLNKTFQKQGKRINAVCDVSFELYPGECFGLIGESGSGKSTLANLVAGLEKADSGAVLHGGIRRTDRSSGERQTGNSRRNTARKDR